MPLSFRLLQGTADHAVKYIVPQIIYGLDDAAPSRATTVKPSSANWGGSVLTKNSNAADITPTALTTDLCTFRLEGSKPFGRVTICDNVLYQILKGREMSTKRTLKFERDEATGEEFHLYEDWPDEDCVFLELEGFAFKSAAWPTSAGMNKTHVRIQIPNRWAQKLGLIEKRAE